MKNTSSAQAVSARRPGQTAKELTEMSIFTAIILIMAFTPLGLIDLPLIKATILHVPVIVGCILLGPKKGAFLGFEFGLTSLIKNSMAPSVLSFAFSPLIPVIGSDHGSPLALVICFLPRILVGVVPYFIYKLIRMIPVKKGISQTIALVAAGASGAFTNTGLVMGFIYIFFKNAYAQANSISVDAVRNVILGVVAANGVPEMLVAAVLVPVLCLALFRTHLFEEN